MPTMYDTAIPPLKRTLTNLSAILKKGEEYADAKKIPYIIIAGEDEINKNGLTIKIMSSGEQKNMPLIELSKFVKEELRSSK